MTETLPSTLSHCYSLLFTGDADFKTGKLIKAMLCFEECRLTAQHHLDKNDIFYYSYFRALRKEVQCHIMMDAHCRAWRTTQKALKQAIDKANEWDRIFILSQALSLAKKFQSNKLEKIRLDLMKALSAKTIQ